jgi:hypothetical protein
MPVASALPLDVSAKPPREWSMITDTTVSRRILVLVLLLAFACGTAVAEGRRDPPRSPPPSNDSAPQWVTRNHYRSHSVGTAVGSFTVRVHWQTRENTATGEARLSSGPRIDSQSSIRPATRAPGPPRPGSRTRRILSVPSRCPSLPIPLDSMSQVLSERCRI